MIEEHDRIVLTEDLPESGFQRGDVGVVVHIHRDGEGYEIEFIALNGETIDVVTVDHLQVRPVAPREIAHARALDGT